MKSPVTIGGFDVTTRHDLIMHLVGLSVDCICSHHNYYTPWCICKCHVQITMPVRKTSLTTFLPGTYLNFRLQVLADSIVADWCIKRQYRKTQF